MAFEHVTHWKPGVKSVAAESGRGGVPRSPNAAYRRGGSDLATRRPKALFSVGGIGIVIDPSWLIIFALVASSLAVGYLPVVDPGRSAGLYWAVSLLIALLFFASVLVHELAHALVSNRLGVEVKSIVLFIFGGMAQLTGEPRDASADLKIAIAGPITSFALGALFGAGAWAFNTAGVPALLGDSLRYLAFANLALALFNSLPGLPLDGGRIARSVFWRRSHDFRAATLRAAKWGTYVGVGIIALGVLEALIGNPVGGLWLVLIGMFLRGAAETTRRAALIERSLAGVHVADVMIPNPVIIDADMTLAEAAERYFMHYGFGGFPVVEGGRVVGLLSLGELRTHTREERTTRRVREAMRAAEASVRVSPTTELETAIRQMADADSGRLLVMDGERLLGLITRSGVARAVETRWLLEESDQYADLVRRLRAARPE